MIAEGHVVGDHSWTHPYFSQLPNTTAAIDQEVVQTSDVIYNFTGRKREREWEKKKKEREREREICIQNLNKNHSPVTGLRPKYFRFPYFDFTPFQMDYILNTLNHIILFDDLDT